MKTNELFHIISQIHGINTRRKLDLYRPQSNLSVYQKGPYYLGVKLFNSLPLDTKKQAHNSRQFKSALPTFHFKSFYTLEESFHQE
jgi:hypothetical protein